MHICQKDLIKNNYKKGDSEGIVNYGLTLSGIQFSVIFIEDENEKINLKYPSDPKKISMQQVCIKFLTEVESNAAGGIFKEI